MNQFGTPAQPNVHANVGVSGRDSNRPDAPMSDESELMSLQWEKM